MDANALINQATEAGDVVDQTDVSSGFEYQAPPEGYTTARFIGYVEVGKQPQRAYEGVEKPDAAEVRLTFELNGPKQLTEYEHDGEKKVRANLLRVTLTISNSEKSNFQKLFKKMLAGRSDVKHMAQMLGEGFLIKISHNKSKDGKKTYANMKKDGVWEIGAPATTDPISNETTVLDVPEARNAVQFLLWAAPSEEQWASVFIDGTYTKKDGDTAVEVSKNFIQELAMSASNFVGSPLEALVAGAPDIVERMMADPEPAPETKPKKEKAAPAEVADDPLAALGL